MTVVESWPARPEMVGPLSIRRALPARRRRTVGPWCFLDRYGPLTFAEGKPMDVAPHPHIGLQTVSWLLEGEVLHRDSLDCEQLIRPGELNLMTSGRGIAHSEESPRASSGRLSGVQLWVALPGESRQAAPAFDHYAELPAHSFRGARATVVLGELDGTRSPARIFSPLLGVELTIEKGARCTIPLRRSFEHALFLLENEVQLGGQCLATDFLHYLGSDRDEIGLDAPDGARLLLIGGEPLRDPVLMWWNFVATTHEEIAEAREAWQRRERFGEVRGYPGPRLEAPSLRGKAKAPAAS